MQYRRLGSSELDVSEISLGSWLTYGGGVERANAEACVAKAVDVRINFFDTANVYARGGAESFLGEVLPVRRRESYVLATKLYFPVNGDRGLSRQQVHKQITGKYQPGHPPAAGTRAASSTMGPFMDRFRDDDLLEAVQRLRPVADGLGITMVQLALAWALSQENLASAIIGASRPEQVGDNASASGIELDESTVRAIDDAVADVVVDHATTR